MKIALISQEYPPETARGGIGTQTYAKAHGLSALGHEVFVISRTIKGRHETKCAGVNVIRIPGMEDSLPEMTEVVQWITHSVSVAAEIDALNRRVGLDIIDFPEWGAEGYVYLLNRTEWYGTATVIQLHGPLVMLAHTIDYPEMNSEFYDTGKMMEATCLRLADAVYSSSACSTRWALEFYNPCKENIPTIHMGVNTVKFAPGSVPKNERPTIIFVGRIVQNKGVEELVDAAVRIAKEIPGLRLCFVGRGEESFVARLKEKAARAGANELLVFRGFIDKDDLPEELSRAHVFASPSYYEGGPGFVFLEAMACGLPVVGCSGSGVDEIVTPGTNGLLVPPRNVEALEAALRKILSDQKILEQMGARAREFVLEKADGDHCLKRLESFYLSIVESKCGNKKAD